MGGRAQCDVEDRCGAWRADDAWRRALGPRAAQEVARGGGRTRVERGIEDCYFEAPIAGPREARDERDGIACALHGCGTVVDRRAALTPTSGSPVREHACSRAPCKSVRVAMIGLWPLLALVSSLLSCTAFDGLAVSDRRTGSREAQAYTDAVNADAPIAFWRFDETGGRVARDATGHKNDCEFEGNVLFAQPSRDRRRLERRAGHGRDAVRPMWRRGIRLFGGGCVLARGLDKARDHRRRLSHRLQQEPNPTQTAAAISWPWSIQGISFFNFGTRGCSSVARA